MNVALIYFNEVSLKEDNKFNLDFSNEEFVQKIHFDKKTDYYIASLDCNLILKEDIKKDQKKLIKELSIISRKLKEKGPDYQVDIGWLTSQMFHIYDFDIEDLTYNWVVQSRLLDDNCYKYRYFDTVKKKLGIVKHFLHLLCLKAMVLNLKDLFHLKVKIMFQYDYLKIIVKFNLFLRTTMRNVGML